MANAPKNSSGMHGRVAGSGFTWFKWDGEVVLFANAISITSPTPVAAPAEVHPLNFRRPAEIVVPRAITAGTLTVTGIEIWNKSFWERLPGMAKATDLADVFQLMWDRGNSDLQATVVIDPPKGKGTNGEKYFRTFHGCKITNIDDGEQIDITTMLLNKTVTFMYTHMSIQMGKGANRQPQFPSEISTTN